MKVVADLCIIPIGVGISLSKYIPACHEILEQTGLKVQLHAYGTNVEGDMDVVLQAVKHCHEKVHAMGAPRISTSLKLGTRDDVDSSIEEKIASVRSKVNLS